MQRAKGCLNPMGSLFRLHASLDTWCAGPVRMRVSCRWVTCVCCLPGGRVLSCGMDGRLWLWPAAGTAGTEVKAAHDAPVSKVAALQHSDSSGAPQTAAPAAAPGRAGLARASSGSSRARAACAGRGQAAAHVLAVSCSYDKTVKVWDVSGRAGKLVSVMSGHAGPVLELAVVPGGGQVLTGEVLGRVLHDLVSDALAQRRSAYSVAACCRHVPRLLLEHGRCANLRPQPLARR
jgi:hypothetical protein